MGAKFEDGAGDEIRSSDLDIVNGLFKLGIEPGTASRIEVQGSIYSDEGTVPPNASDAGDPDTDVDRDAVVRNFSLGWTYAPAGNPAVDLSVLAYATDLKITEAGTAARTRPAMKRWASRWSTGRAWTSARR